MAVQQRADDAPVQHTGERLVVLLGPPASDEVVALLEARIRNPFGLLGPQPKQAL
jgi:hypothetical protein